MKNIALIILTVSLFVSCSSKNEIPRLLEGRYTISTISFDEAKPDINLEKDNLKDILILLHHRITPGEIKIHFGMSDSVWNVRINYLFGEGLIKKFEDSSFIPTVFVLDEKNGTALKKLTDSLGVEMSGIAIDRLNKIKEAYQKIPSLKNIPFENLSMLVLGGFAHDFEMLRSYQEYFIKALVPRRGYSNYYMCLLQNTHDESNTKFYKIEYYQYPSFKLVSFSSTLYERNIATYSTSELIHDFGKPVSESDSVYQVFLLNKILLMNSNTAYKLSSRILDSFVKTGVVVNEKPTIPFITRADMKKIKTICDSAAQDIISYFESRQTLFVKWYLNSPYREETSYKEWMIWVYKMITAKTIDVLAEKSYIKTFGGNTAAFILEK
ncbi:MAG: hypothetical protein AB1394_06675 [Bacteroidota bacterium]